ncbi:MAG: BTAD domain-containing putative transcriptional regulator [Hyphomicrobiales bacterium]
MIEPSRVDVDVDRFLAALNSSEEAALERALSHYTGPFLDGFFCGSAQFEDWSAYERDRLQSQAISVLERLARNAGGERGIAFARRLIAVEPTREASYRLKMKLLAANGHRDKALRIYEACREMLVRELGVEPSEETQSLRKTILERTAVPVAAPATPPPELHIEMPKVQSERHALALTGFVNLTGERKDDFLAEGLLQDIATALSRNNEYAIVSRLPNDGGTSAADVARAAADKGARYLLGGGIQRAANRLRLNVHLLDTGSGRHVWSERFDAELDDLLDFQDRVAHAVDLGVRIELRWAAWSVRDKSPPGSFEVRLLVNEAMAKYYESTAESLAAMLQYARTAVALEPENPRAMRVLALALCASMNFGTEPRTAEAIAQAVSLAQASVRAVPDDEIARNVSAWALSIAGRHEEAVAELNHAIRINPNFPGAHSDLAEQHALLGNIEEGKVAIRQSIKLNGFDPSDYWQHFVMAMIEFAANRNAAALEEARRAVRAQPGYVRAAIYWAAAAAGAGEGEEASRAVKHCLAQMPDLRVSNVAPGVTTRYVDDALHARFLQLLEKAGLPA